MPQSQQSERGTSIIVDKILKTFDQVVLDIGAGEGKWGKLLKGKVRRIDGIEVWKPYIDRYQLRNFYDTLYETDLRSFRADKEYDTVILGDVLEHLVREDAMLIIHSLKLQVKSIYLTIPITICVQDGNVIGNPFETHYYHWSDKELRNDLGFTLLNVSVNDNGLVAIGCYEWRK
jgi:predicted TPR repeat methyltransferase